MAKRLMCAGFMMTVLLFIPMQDANVSANSMDDVEQKLKELEEEQSELKGKRDDIESEKSTTDEKLDENKSQQTTVEEEINTLDDQLMETVNAIYVKEEEITGIEEEITSLGEQIEELDENIDELIIRIKERDELLKKRLRSIQETGGLTHYLEVLFGSQSFSDFISRSSAVNTIMDQDVKIMNEQTEDKLALESNLEEVKDKKEEVEHKKVEVEDQKEQLTALKTTLDGQLEEKETLMGQLEEEYEELDEYKLTLEEEQKLIQAQEDSLAKAREVAASEKERLEQLAKEEEARKKKEQEEAEKAKKEKTPGNNPVATPEPEYDGGTGQFIWPTTSRGITSPFGTRTHPVTGEPGKMHYGVDFGVYRQPVFSSASGVVTSTHAMSGYGNTVVITHIIDGKTFTTLYAHLESISVSPGQVVTQGEQIAISGNTGGSSTGHHLHFEIHNGPWNSAKSNAVNPVGYLP